MWVQISGQEKTALNHIYLNTNGKGRDLCRLFKEGEYLESDCLGLGTSFTTY